MVCKMNKNKPSYCTMSLSAVNILYFGIPMLAFNCDVMAFSVEYVFKLTKADNMFAKLNNEPLA